MLFLRILGGIFAVLLILLLIPVIVCFDFECGAPKLVIRYAFVWKTILPVVEKEKKKSKSKDRRKKKKKAQEEEADARVRDMLKTALILLRSSKKALDLLRRGTVITRLKLLISVGGEDAHDAAERYGKYAAALFPALDILSTLFSVREPSVYMAPNFLSEETVMEASVQLRLRPITALAAALHLAVRFIGALAREKQHNQDSKGGNQYERKTSRQ